MERRKSYAESFNFTEYAQRLLDEAEAKGIKDNLIFKTQFKEFCRLNSLCDRMWGEIDNGTLTEPAYGKKGEETVKSNPLIKDYTTAHNTLITTANSLFKLLDSVKAVEKDDEYFM